jgi:hypothetical protein
MCKSLVIEVFSGVRYINEEVNKNTKSPEVKKKFSNIAVLLINFTAFPHDDQFRDFSKRKGEADG